MGWVDDFATDISSRVFHLDTQVNVVVQRLAKLTPYLNLIFFIILEDLLISSKLFFWKIVLIV